MSNSRALRSFRAALQAYPAAFRGNPLNLLFLDDAAPIDDPLLYLRQLDSRSLMEERIEYVTGRAIEQWPFPVTEIADRPEPWELSQLLFSRFDRACTILKRQKDLAQVLEEAAVASDVDVVALVVVDGLSYYDVPESLHPEPYLVDGASITQVGYRDVVGTPSVSQRLFNRGYRIQHGFTYFDRETNTLAGDLFSVFGSSQVRRISAFEEVFESLTPAGLPRGYVQITMPGLDDLSHFHRDKPPRDRYFGLILERFEALIDHLRAGGRRVMACLTADHGIWWREDLEQRAVVVEDLQPQQRATPRYLEGDVVRDYTLVRRSYGKAYSLLRPPLLTRRLKRTEWGVHGGVSAWESVVPAVFWRT